MFAIGSVLLFVLLAATLSLAQITSTIHGQIKDQQGLALPDAAITVTSPELAVSRTMKSDASGSFVVVGLPAAKYEIEVSKAGFATKKVHLELTVNQDATTSIELSVAAMKTEVSVSAEMVAFLETTTSSTGSTINPVDIESQPLNGRNYLDLMQLVPGVIVNSQNDTILGSDDAVPVLGQRGNNAQFLIDGMPNNDGMNGGASSQFNQDAILEFQVLTAGYKAEFGHGSGGVINVISKSGTNAWHGLASAFYRNHDLDSSNSDLVNNGAVPFLQRWDPSVQFGGPIKTDKIFLFASGERIMEDRHLNWQFPATTPPIIEQVEGPFNRNTLDNETRARLRLDEQTGTHRFSEQMNYTNAHTNDYNPLSAWTSLPDTRYNFSSRNLMLGVSDTATLGNQSNPFLLNYFIQFRDNPTYEAPTWTQAGIPYTYDNLFSSLYTGDLFGDQGQVIYGPGFNDVPIRQKYWSAGLNVGRRFGQHTLKLGWNFERTMVDGDEAITYFNQLFSLEADLPTYTPIESGLYYLNEEGSPATSHIGLRNNYDGLFLQDDWQVAHNVNINLGLRWDYDSEFAKNNISPRLGMSWQLTPKTVIRASWGRFYDHFRLGLARDVGQFGGATVYRSRFLSFPRLFYGNPSTLTQDHASIGRNIPCVAQYWTDAQIAANPGNPDYQCYYDGYPVPGYQLYGIDHLNSVVAAGHAPVPAGAVVTESNVQQVTGLTPDQFLAAAAVAIGQAPGYWQWDPFGNMGNTSAYAAYNVPITVDPSFTTPYTDTFHVGLQQQLSATLGLTVDYYHSTISNMLGVRDTNLEFIARLPGYTNTFVPGTGTHVILGFGPWYDGFYDGVTVSVSKRLSKRFQFEASYSYSKEWDNALNSALISNLQAGQGAAYAASDGPSDSYKGPVPVVTDVTTGQTNANGPFWDANNGNPVPQAGTYYNGANLDYGRSDLSVPQNFTIHGIVQLPWKFEISDIFRAQSGFAYSQTTNSPIDVDGDGLFNGQDHNYVRNAFSAPRFVNMDIRVAKNFKIGERTKVDAYFEMFNLFNGANPAAIQTTPYLTPALGAVTQVLPGREGQAGLRITF
jgi:hypothetical protein